MDISGVLPVKAVEVMRSGCAVCPIPALSSLSSKRAGWDGIALESFSDVPGVSIPDHDHPTHFLNLLTHGNIKAQWTTEGKSRSADNGPGTIYVLPAGTRDRLTWSGPTTRIILVMEPGFLSRSLEDTAHLKDVELTTHWNLHDRHIQSLMLALHADLEDGSPAGPLYGESLGLALGTYLVRRYSVRNCAKHDCRGSMPTMRLNRTLEFINQNLARDLRLWELAQIAGMSPNYFCELFKVSTGLPPYQYILRCRIERAKQYLRDPKITLACAGEAAGFADQRTFLFPLPIFLGRPIRFDRRNRLHGAGIEASFRENTMNTTIAVTKDVTTLINILTVEPQNQQKLIELLRDSTDSVITRLDGWISTSFIAAMDQRHVVVYSQWRDLASIEAMRTNPDMVAYFPKIAAFAAFDSLAGDVVYNHHA